MSKPISSSDTSAPSSANEQIEPGCGVKATAGGSPPSTRIRNCDSKSSEPVNWMSLPVVSL
jgi:hypothetical protein